MTGLEKILEAIQEQAQNNAGLILADAKKQAGEILATAEVEAAKRCEEIALKSEIEAESAINRAKSKAMLQEKKMMLNAKQQIINDIIEEARRSLIESSEQDYVDVLLRMALKYAHAGEGVILFSAEDKNRLPSDFNKLLEKALNKRDGVKLVIADETVMIDGGFILKYGDVEENCSFEALFAAAREDLQDKVNAFLFN